MKLKKATSMLSVTNQEKIDIMKNRLYIACFAIFCSMSSFGQQEAQFTQYNDNMMYYNPGYTGSRGMLNITGIHRQQWIGIDGAPMSQSLFIHTPLKYESVGVGLSVLNDRQGPLNQTWVNGNFSYSFKISETGRLAFGLTGGVNISNANFSNLVQTDANDPLTLGGNYTNKITPLFGGGLYYHSDKFYAGVSVPKILETKDLTTGRLPEQRHYYAMLGGYIGINRMIKLRPSALVKITENAPLAVDGSLAMIIYDKFWLGVNYRLLESAGLLVQFQLTPQFKVGYSVDFSTSKLIKHNAGTHEIMLSYDMNFNKKKIVTPRYF